MNAAAQTTTSAARTTFTKGDLVFVLPGYSMDTKQRTRIDAWTETHMIVIEVMRNGDCLLDYDENGEGEVYINEGRLELVAT